MQPWAVHRVCIWLLLLTSSALRTLLAAACMLVACMSCIGWPAAAIAAAAAAAAAAVSVASHRDLAARTHATATAICFCRLLLPSQAARWRVSWPAA